MKTVYIWTMMALALAMLLTPLGARNSIRQVEASVDITQGQVTNQSSEETVKIKLTESNEIITLPVSDYIFGVVAAEMPALYESEALKAQAVAAYTYYLVQKDSNSEEEYDITDDYTIDQAFVTAEDARAKWGDGAEQYESKIRDAVEAVGGKKVLYDGELASTVYHAISFGVTEDASAVWGGKYPYLVSVDSSWDKLHENYLSEKKLSAQELSDALKELVEIKDNTQSCISDITRTEAGGVKTLKIAGVSVSGSDFRKALSLRSANFDIEFKDGSYTITTKGYGHAIGMSQYGAHYMAMQGKSYEEILLHYYKGCEIK